MTSAVKELDVFAVKFIKKETETLSLSLSSLFLAFSPLFLVSSTRARRGTTTPTVTTSHVTQVAPEVRLSPFIFSF